MDRKALFLANSIPMGSSPSGVREVLGKKFELYFLPVQLCLSRIIILHQHQRNALYLKVFIMQQAQVINIKLKFQVFQDLCER